MRTANVVVSFLEPDAAPVPLSTPYNVSTHGYKSPTAPYYFAPPRLKSNVTFEKSIGVSYWNEQSSIDFGNIDISIEDDGADEIAGEVVRWVEWAKQNLNPQVLLSVEQADGTLLHIATADSEDVYFPDDRTIRVKLVAKHQRKLEQYINDYFDDTVDDEVQGLPVPIYLGGGDVTINDPYDPATQVTRMHVPTILVDEVALRYVVTTGAILAQSPNTYFVMDRGVTLLEGGTPGFTLTADGFELTDNPDGTITFAWVADQGGGVDDPHDTGNVLQGPFRLARWAVARAGIDIAEHFPAEIDFPDLLPTGFFDYDVPIIYYGSEVTARTMLNDIVDGLSAWWYVDELGDFQFGKLVNPSDETPTFAYTDVEMIGAISARVDRATGLSNTMQHAWNPGAYDPSNVAGSVPIGRRRALTTEWRQVQTTATIPDVYSVNRGNEPMKLRNDRKPVADPNIVLPELNRIWEEYYSGIRRFYRWTVPLRGGVSLPNLGDVGTIQSQRAELLEYGPLPVLVRRMKYDLGAGLVDIEGWGGETNAPPLSGYEWLIGSDAVYPDTIASLVCRLKASDTSKMLTSAAGNPPIAGADNNTFDRWVDSAPSSVADYWLNGSNALVYRTSINGHPAVDIKPVAVAKDSGGTSIKITNNDASDQSITAIAVFSSTDSGFVRIFGSGAGLGNLGLMGTYKPGFVPNSYVQGQSASTAGSTTYATTSSIPARSGVLITGFRADVAANAFQGIDEGDTGGTNSLSGSFFNASGQSEIGSFFGFTGGGEANYYLHELLVFNEALSTADLTTLRDWLVTEYGI